MIENKIDEDYQLFLDATKGNDRAFNKLYSRNKDFLYWKINFKGYDKKADIDDLFQGVWEKVIKLIKANSYRAESSFKTFLTTLCKNHCIDVIRGTKTNKPEHNSVSIDDEAVKNIEDDIRIEVQRPLTPVQLSILEQDRDLVLSVLAKLSTEKREIFYLKAAGGMTCDEIAKSMGIKIDRVKDRLKQARQELHNLLEKQLSGDELGELLEEQL
jgi:RNA polymerase sigma factor (sigma-70 family)